MEPQEADASLSGQIAAAQEALAAALIQTGVLGKIKAQLRIAALAVINGNESHLQRLGGCDASLLPDATKLALMLVNDFLESKVSSSLPRSHGIFHEEANMATVAASGGSNLVDQHFPQHLRSTSTSAPSLLESLLASMLEGTMTQGATKSAAPLHTPPAASGSSLVQQQQEEDVMPSGGVRASSPDIETPAATTTVASAPLSRKNSMSAGQPDTCEDSIEYSDHSANSSLDDTNCAAVERIASANRADTSDDDF